MGGAFGDSGFPLPADDYLGTKDAGVKGIRPRGPCADLFRGRSFLVASVVDGADMEGTDTGHGGAVATADAGSSC